MERSDAQETIAALYLRLNGYFVGSFIAHAAFGNLTEIDILAVRFPFHREEEREIGLCHYLNPPTDLIDIVIGEVKGGCKQPTFNTAFRDRPEAIAKVLRRIGAFPDSQIEQWTQDVPSLLEPKRMAGLTIFPSLSAQDRQIRFILFAPDQSRQKDGGPVIFGSDMVGYIRSCLRPDTRRQQCDTSGYDRKLWGHQFNELVAYFKNFPRPEGESINDIYRALGCDGAA